MEHRISGVAKGSLAQRQGVLPGDILLSVNGEPVEDEIDYQYLIAQTPVTLTVRREDQTLSFTFPKIPGGGLGLEFGESMSLCPRTCRNNCVFCFIAQMPPHLRETLYVKDDDWRFSLMMGNYITLTNVDDAEFDRILRRKASPLYISVHATDAALRCDMMHNRFAGNIMERLTRLKNAGIRFHCQIVCCPGWNDGDVLLQTLRDLRSLHPAACTVAVVPVGLTRFREKLPHLTPFDDESAGKLLDLLAPFQQECRETLGTTFVFPSDEFYCLSGRVLPDEEWYEDYPQIENGVGLITKLESEVRLAQRFADDDLPCKPATYLIPTGVSAAPHLKRLADTIAPKQVTVKVLPIVNRFFGETVTVTGLLTGGDVLAALTPEVLSGVDAVLLSNSMLRSEGDLFLDDLHIDAFRQALPVPVHVLDNDGDTFFQALHGVFPND